MPSLPDRHSRGFTLLELLVAMAILTIVAVTALNNNSTMINNTAYLEEKTLAHWVAMNKAAELRLSDKLVSNEGLQGVAVMAGRRWRWQATGKETPDPDIQLINIKVRADNDQTETTLTDLTMYMGRPAGYRIN